MRVLAVSHSAVVDAYREKFRILARRQGWELHLVLPHAWPEGGGEIAAPTASREGSLRLHVLHARFAGRVGFVNYAGLRALSRVLKPGLVYCEEEPYSLAASQALSCAQDAGAALVVYSWENLRRRYRFPLMSVLKRVLAGASGLVGGSRETLRVLGPLRPGLRTLVQPQYGVNCDRFRPARRRAKGFVAGYFGRLAPEKGVDTLLRAAAASGVKVRIGGRGPMEAPLKALAAELGAEAELVGFVPFQRRHEFYQGLGALVLPSRTTPRWKEQFGRVLAEAMACGVPCVGSDSGAIPEVLGKAGLCFPEGDAGALAAKLTRLAADAGLRRRLSGLGRRRSVERFDEPALARELGAFLEKVAA